MQSGRLAGNRTRASGFRDRRTAGYATRQCFHLVRQRGTRIPARLTRPRGSENIGADVQTPKAITVKAGGFILAVAALVCLPFVLFGEDFALPWLKSHEQQTGALILIAIALLAADAVAPVPSTFVLMFLAAKAGTIAGILGGTAGLTAGVLASAWLGRAAVGRIAPKFFPESELKRLRENLQERLAFTLACWRSVPVMAETTVILAAAAGVPVRRILLVTLLPNFLVATIYSVAADNSFATACIAFFAALVASWGLWWFVARRD